MGVIDIDASCSDHAETVATMRETSKKLLPKAIAEQFEIYFLFRKGMPTLYVNKTMPLIHQRALPRKEWALLS